MAAKFPVVVIVGPTASGKTSFAIELAQKYDGEIICADSRTIYKGMDIGTAKPSHEEQAGIPHWGLDLVLPSERYTVAEFKEYTFQKIAEIRARNKVPIIVGGTGLYIDAVVFDYRFPRPWGEGERTLFAAMSREELIEYCVKNNIQLPIDDKNKRRILRAISDPDRTHERKAVPEKDFIVVGIATKKDVLEQRIADRTEHMFENGVVEEATMLGKKYGWNAEAMTSNVYRIIRLYLEGLMTLTDAKDKFTTRDRQLAKRQMTWFRRNQFIEWCHLTEAAEYVDKRLAAEYKL